MRYQKVRININNLIHFHHPVGISASINMFSMVHGIPNHILPERYVDCMPNLSKLSRFGCNWHTIYISDHDIKSESDEIEITDKSESDDLSIMVCKRRSWGVVGYQYTNGCQIKSSNQIYHGELVYILP